MKNLTILSITLLFFITSCSTEKHKDEQMQSEEALANPSASDLVQLDNGNKWIANIETTEGIERMAQMIDAAKSEHVSSAASLKEDLLLEFTDILNKCTMKGESHEQLHNYLLSLKTDIEKLPKTPSEDALNNISSYLDTYHNYFK